MFLFITALIFMFISKLRFPKKVSIVTILNRETLIQIFPTRMCNVTARRHSRLCAHWLMVLVGPPPQLGPLAKGEREEVYILRSPGISASPIALLSMGGICGRSLTAGKILFTGRQTCSLYLVL